MNKATERLVDTAYRRATSRSITGLIGTASELSTPRALELAGDTIGVLGKSALGAIKFGGFVSSEVGRGALKAAGLGVEVLDLSQPGQRLEYRERTITTNSDIIMSDYRGVILGTYLFRPWSEAAWAVDMSHGAEHLKPPIALAEDYFVTLGERGVTDGAVREAITKNVLEAVPKDMLDVDSLELLETVDLHSMVRP